MITDPYDNKNYACCCLPFIFLCVLAIVVLMLIAEVL
jgi:hypothetical protein